MSGQTVARGKTVFMVVRMSGVVGIPGSSCGVQTMRKYKIIHNDWIKMKSCVSIKIYKVTIAIHMVKFHEDAF